MSITKSVDDIIPIIRGLIDDKSRVDGRDSYSHDTDNVFNAQGLKNFVLRAKYIRLTLSGSTSPDLTCWIL